MRRIWLGAGLIIVAAILVGVTIAVSAPASGAVRTVAVGNWPLAVAVDPKTGYAFVVDHSDGGRGFFFGDGKLSIVDTRRATLIRSVVVGPDPRAVAVDESSGQVLVANDDDATVSVLDTRSGAMLRSIDVGSRPHGVAVDSATGRAVVVNTGDGTISTVNSRRGTLVSSTAFSGAYSLQGTAADPRRGLLFVAGAGMVTVLDSRTGTVRRTIPLDQEASNIAIDERNGHLLVTSGNDLGVIDPGSGRVLRTIQLNAASGAVAVDPRRGRIFVVSSPSSDSSASPTGHGSVTILDAETGSVLRTLPVGVDPIAVAVDEGTGRAVVVNSGGTVAMSNPLEQAAAWLHQWVPIVPTSAGSTRVEPGSVSIVNPAG